MAELCCVINPEWGCDYCAWQICGECIDIEVNKNPQLYEFIDDLHNANSYCSQRAKRV